jgi:hypothetical protein
VFPLDLVAGMFAVAGLLLIFGALNRRAKRPELAEPRRYQASIADEAQRWLDQSDQ